MAPYDMRREDLGFLARAPVVHAFDAVVAAPREQVFAALADPTTWSRWFPGVKQARYTSPPPQSARFAKRASRGRSGSRR